MHALTSFNVGSRACALAASERLAEGQRAGFTTVARRLFNETEGSSMVTKFATATREDLHDKYLALSALVRGVACAIDFARVSGRWVLVLARSCGRPSRVAKATSRRVSPP